jgi:sec-independent protein translocase protein TatB
MGREFSRAMEQAAQESGVKDVAKDLKAATSAKGLGLDKVKEAADRFEKWDPIKNAAKPSAPAKPLVPAPMPSTPEVVSEAVSERILGPETQALMDQKAAKQAIVAKASKDLKAVEAAAKPAAKAAVKPRAKKPVAAAEAAKPRVKAEVAKPVAKPRAPRKSKKADEA